jgi:hypothetical protein
VLPYWGGPGKLFSFYIIFDKISRFKNFQIWFLGFYLKFVQIWKYSKLKMLKLKIIQISKCSNLKIVHILKMFRFENSSNMKIARIWEFFEYENCSD